MSTKPAWMNQEEERADTLTAKNETSNNHAPKLVRVTKAPERKQKAFYIQEKYERAFDDFAYKQKRSTRIKAPELAEEAIRLLLEKYGEDTSNLL